MANAQRDENRAKTLIGVSHTNSDQVVLATVDPDTGRLRVDATGTVTGQQYTEGDADATITGNAVLLEAPANTLIPAQADTSGNLKVNIVAGSATGTEYTEGDTDATITGTAVLGESTGDALTPLQLDSSGFLKISIEGDNVGIGGSTQYAEDAAHQTGDMGTLALAVRQDTATQLADTDGDYTPLITDVNGRLHTNVGNTVTVTGTITADAGTNLNTSALALESGGNLATIAGAVAGTEVQVDIVDSLPAGTNNIGDVDIASALPAGTNTIGAIEVDGVAGANGQVSVDTTANGIEVVAASAGRMGVLLRNQGSVSCYVGFGNVTTSNAVLLEAGETMYLPTDSQVKAVTASSSTTVGYIALA